jgi:predicted phage baseplate assembly protein
VLRDFPPSTLSTSGTTPFNFRSTTLFVQSERLPLAPLPVLSAATGQDLVLSSMTLGLRPGRAVWISGELLDDPGVKRSEIRSLTAVSHHQGLTAIQLNGPLSYRYRRDTVRINANVVPATHGEGGDFEILGSGDINQRNQRFPLRRSGLAFQPQRDGLGITSGVEVVVAGVPWREVATLFGQAPDAPVFVVLSDIDGGTEIVFGDGVNGSRLPSGRDNLRVRYRVAKTAQGGVEAETLSLLRSHPLGVRSVNNPLSASGQAGPPTLADLRQAAPVQTQLLNRLVSLQDYEQYAATFPGIGKARADLIATDDGRSVLITVVGSDGQEAPPALLANLTRSAAQLGDPLQGLRLLTTRPQFFRLRAGLVTQGSAADNGSLITAARQALLTAFSVAERAFAQDVGVSEVIRVLQSVPGVIAALLDDFNLTTASQRGVVQLLSSSAARANRRRGVLEIQPATLLLLHPLEIQLYSVTP